MGIHGGKAPTPSAIRQLEGNKKAGTAEVLIPDATFFKPDELSEDASQVWDRLAPILAPVGLLKEADQEAFASYCEAVAMWRESTRDINENGAIVDAPVFNRNGDVTGFRRVPNQAFYTQKEANAVMLRYAGRFGLTPADRVNLKTAELQGSQPGDARRYLTA